MYQVDGYPRHKTTTITTPVQSTEQWLSENGRTFIGPGLLQTTQGCLWDNLTEEQKRQPMMLHCPCPKCSASC